MFNQILFVGTLVSVLSVVIATDPMLSPLRRKWPSMRYLYGISLLLSAIAVLLVTVVAGAGKRMDALDILVLWSSLVVVSSAFSFVQLKLIGVAGERGYWTGLMDDANDNKTGTEVEVEVEGEDHENRG